jgi:F-type H+-transporting ATPase subunit delta
MTSRVARRYAKALFSLAQEAQALDAIAAELRELRQAFDDPAIIAVLASPLTSASRLTALVRQLTEQLALSTLTKHFLGVLAENRRLDQLAGVYEHFEALHDRALGRIRVTIRGAASLPPERQREIVTAFEQRTGKTVLATVVTDPVLLGGVVVEAEGKVYDGSLRTQLEHLARDMAGARIYL